MLISSCAGFMFSHTSMLGFSIQVWAGKPWSSCSYCLEWWSFELLILLSGLLPHPELETSVLFYMSQYDYNTLYNTIWTWLLQQETSIVSTILLASGRVFGYTFSNEKEVVDYVATMAPLVSLSVILDSLQGVLSGVARGTGWQHIGALCQPGGILSLWNSSCCSSGFLDKIKRKGAYGLEY
uniref:Uncharacterized protein n=1 Tax=Fagus sylvatica TaxID=28930 RepID=A0A2N9ICG4_FAGSY